MYIYIHIYQPVGKYPIRSLQLLASSNCKDDDDTVFAMESINEAALCNCIRIDDKYEYIYILI
jgi:hypothetical protein